MSPKGRPKGKKGRREEGGREMRRFFDCNIITIVSSFYTEVHLSYLRYITNERKPSLKSNNLFFGQGQSSVMSWIRVPIGLRYEIHFQIILLRIRPITEWWFYHIDSFSFTAQFLAHMADNT